MKRTAILNQATADRCKKLGDIGEELTPRLLKANGFTNIENLNQTQKNFPFADFSAEKDGRKYVISVKIRNKYEFRTKRLNGRYKLGPKCHEHATNAERLLSAKAAWLTISLDKRTYSAYFGLLSSLNGSRGVSMSDKAVLKYDCLAKDAPH